MGTIESLKDMLEHAGHPASVGERAEAPLGDGVAASRRSHARRDHADDGAHVETDIVIEMVEDDGTVQTVRTSRITGGRPPSDTRPL